MPLIVRLLLFIVAFALPLSTSAQQPAAPNSGAETYIVDDRANLLSEKERIQVEGLLKEHNDSSFGFIRLVILSKLPEGVTIEEMSDTFLVQGRTTPSARQDQVLLIISIADRRLRISITELVRSVLSDSACARIIENQIVPHFRKNEFHAGIVAGLGSIITATSAAAAPRSTDSAEKMLIVLQTEKHHQDRLAALDTLNRRSFAERLGKGMPLTAEQREAVETAVVTASQIVRTELAWTRIKPDLIRIIQETFDDEELSSILSLHATAADKASPQNFPNVEEKFAKYMFERINAVGPMIQAEIDRELGELRRSQLDRTSDPLGHLKGDWVVVPEKLEFCLQATAD